jgi:phosphate transport system ATP-binding protein
VADETAFSSVDSENDGDRTGYLVEYGDTQSLFEQPKEQHTREYIGGEFS